MEISGRRILINCSHLVGTVSQKSLVTFLCGRSAQPHCNGTHCSSYVIDLFTHLSCCLIQSQIFDSPFYNVQTNIRLTCTSIVGRLPACTSFCTVEQTLSLCTAQEKRYLSYPLFASIVHTLVVDKRTYQLR